MPVGRKRWNLHDGPQGSLRRLRSQLAEDGCAESQVVLAKQLLEEKCELEADKVSNFKQALEWLICATEQAHPEARRMLRRCISSGVIEEHSAAIVRAKSCLAASRQETVARKAARDLFASLSNGEQYITTAQLEQRIRDICAVARRAGRGEGHDEDDEVADGTCARALGGAAGAGQALEPSPEAGDQPHSNGTIRPSQGDNDDAAERCSGTDDIRNLTVDNLVSAAVDYCQGELPLVSYELTLTDPGIKALDHVPILHQAFLHPIVFIQVLYLKLLYYFGSFSFRLSNIELSLLLVAYLSVNTDSLYHLVPLVLYYVSFVAMVICTFKMLHAKRQFVDFRKWSGLFLRYSDGNLQPDESENLFVRNNLAPFVQFFVALLVNLFLYPFIATQWVPFSEFCVLSFFLMFLTLFSFGSSTYPDILALLSFALNVLAKYPYEKDTVVHQGWRFLDLHISNYPSYILGNSIEFCLNARVFFSLLIPVILIYMARRWNWQGVFKSAIPHCVTLSWLQMFIMCSHGCTTYGLIRGTLGLVCTFLFLPLIGIVTVTLPMFACLQCVTLTRVVYTIMFVTGLGACLATTCMLAKMEATKKFVTPFQLLIGLLTLLYFGNQFLIDVEDGIPNRLIELFGDEKPSFKRLLKNEFPTEYEDNMYQVNWDDYYTHCHVPSWSDYNMAATQMKCSVLEGGYVNWEGYVQDVRVKSVRNQWSDFAEWLPGLLQEYFKCLYGEEYATLCQSGGMNNRDCEFVRSVARQSGKSCHLDNLNEYTYEVKLTMESGGLLKRHADVTIVFDHHFTNYTKLLRQDDKIRFKGVLTNPPEAYNIGTKDVGIKGYEIFCLECKEARGSISSKAPSVSKLSQLVKTIINDCVVSTKYILNFILNPVIIVK